jgi:hypothetical protein
MAYALIWLAIGIANTGVFMLLRREIEERWVEDRHDYWFLPVCVVFWPIIMLAMARGAR